MTKPQHQIHAPSWLREHLDAIPPPAIPTYAFLTKLGESTLTAKIKYVEEYNMNVPARLRKRIPDKLDFNEIAVIYQHVFIFRFIWTSAHSKDGVLGVYVPSSTDIWEDSGLLEDSTGIYSTNETFHRHLAKIISPTIRPRDIEDVLDYVESFAPKVHITINSHLFPVNNGIYNQLTKQLEPFSPKYVYLTKIRSDYNPQATNPVIQNSDGSTWDVETWLNELSVSSAVNTLLWQVIAASLQPNRGMNKSIWFYSDIGNNGKGTMGQLIKNLLGPNNYASLSVEDFKHEFKKQDLIQVAANIADENDVEAYIDSVKDYKASITGDDIIINRKYKDPIRLQFRGLNIQMMNGLPKTKDKTGSFYRRIIIVPFIKSFTNNGERSYIKSDYVYRQEVLEYVLLKALHLEFDEFIVPAESAFLLEQYKERNNPVLDFWNEMREEFAWDLIPKQFLYDLYHKWFERNNPSGKIIGQRTFFDSLSPIIDSDGAWENHIGSDKNNIRTNNRMQADEPLITEYGLDAPYKNGALSPWANHQYRGTNPQKKRDFERKSKYRGIVRT